jgi:hypothetical protein
MSLSANKIILAGSTAVTNTAGAYYQPLTISAANSSGTGTLVPAGIWQAPGTANVAIQFNTSNNSASLTWVTIVGTASAGLFISDGVNVQAVTNDTTTHNVTLYGPNGGNAVSGTFNAS